MNSGGQNSRDHKGGFTVQLMKLKLPGHLTGPGSFQGPGRVPGNVFTFPYLVDKCTKVRHFNHNWLRIIEVCQAVS